LLSWAEVYVDGSLSLWKGYMSVKQRLPLQ